MGVTSAQTADFRKRCLDAEQLTCSHVKAKPPIPANLEASPRKSRRSTVRRQSPHVTPAIATHTQTLKQGEASASSSPEAPVTGEVSENFLSTYERTRLVWSSEDTLFSLNCSCIVHFPCMHNYQPGTVRIRQLNRAA
jgi:hypothetical protein